MDGIETARAIRALPGEYFQKLPIVVLTANAIAGMRDMFLKTGFNDYLSKPIEIVKLDELIARWIPAEKQIKAGTGIKRETLSGASGILIPGVDTQKGVAMTGGTETGYRRVLAQFYKDAAERLPLFAAIPAETTLATFAAHAHALKSAAGTIGAAGISADAAELEAAGKAGDMSVIAQALPAFTERLEALVEGIGAALEATSTAGPEEGAVIAGPAPGIAPLLRELAEDLQAKKAGDIDRALEELLRRKLDRKIRKTIEQISDDVLMAEYDKALETLNTLLGTEQ
jgi:CheY-like chemotaxis protein